MLNPKLYKAFTLLYFKALCGDSWFPTITEWGISAHLISVKAVNSSLFKSGLSKKSPKEIISSQLCLIAKSSAQFILLIKF